MKSISEIESMRRLVCAFKPFQAPESCSAENRRCNKEASLSKKIDDMDKLEGWVHEGLGSIDLSREKSFDGSFSVCMKAPTKDYGETNWKGRPFGKCVARKNIEAEDWRDYNRLSLYVYPEAQGFNHMSVFLMLHNEGTRTMPDWFLKEGTHVVHLKLGEWNYITWEIASVARDKVTGVSIAYMLQGNEPGAAENVTIYLDCMELQCVEADHYKGWNVAPGLISYCQSGYRTEYTKLAFADGSKTGPEGIFTLNDADTGKCVLTRTIQTRETLNGLFDILDFSDYQSEGEYFLQYNGMKTQTFPISRKVWRNSVWKMLNFFFCERCGYPVQGVHGICHSDWKCTHDGKEVSINGGWHDAGDMSQSSLNTADASLAMFRLAENYRNEDPELAERLSAEALWGTEWLAKTCFEDGYRSMWSVMDFYTDNISGTKDDILDEAQKNIRLSVTAAAAEAAAALWVKSKDSPAAYRYLKLAEKDFSHGYELVDFMKVDTIDAAFIVIAAAELYKATGDREYLDKAALMADYIISAQETGVEGKAAAEGLFHISSDKKDIIHHPHWSKEGVPVTALVEISRTVPEHPDNSKWHAAIRRYCSFYKRNAALTEPYMMFPDSAYDINSSGLDPEENDMKRTEYYRKQVRNGADQGNGFYIRKFPVWFDFRGGNSTLLAHVKALAAAAELLQDMELMDLCHRQLQWVAGLNPFCRSLIFGEGYDCQDQYAPFTGNITGGIIVGIETQDTEDTPFLPASTLFNYGEVWVHISLQWLAIMEHMDK